MSQPVQHPAPATLRIQARRLFWRLAGARRRQGVPVWLARLDVTYHRVPLAGLPEPCRGLRIVQLSDLHMGPLFGQRAVERVVALANAQRPDLTLVTGDFVQCVDEAMARQRIDGLAGLRARLGVYGCLGNHDYWEDAPLVWELAQQAGITMLNNTAVVPIEGLHLAAVDDPMAGRPDLDAVRRELTGAQAVILMSHSPGILDQLGDEPWLVLAGHTHGLQFSVPGIDNRRLVRCAGVDTLVYATEWWGAHAHDAPLSSIVSYRYPAGWFTNGRTRMYVTRGVGFLQTVPLRMRCPSEMTVFTLTD